jgi:predicted bacteriocin transport accessory protein
MKKIFTFLGIILISIIFIICIYLGVNRIKEKYEIENYNNYVVDFSKIDIPTIQNKLDNNEPFFLYVGRSTCPWCRKLVPFLHELSINKKIDLFYLDSTNTDTDYELKEFRDYYGIQYVPTVIFFYKNNEYEKAQLDITLDNFNIEVLNHIMDPYISIYNIYKNKGDE